MRRLAGILVAACFYYSGLVGIARWLLRCSGRRLIILNYHRARGGDLRRHLLYLRRHYRMLHLEEALEELSSSNASCKQGRDRRPPLVLTFDDGYHDNYTHAFALACELEVPITIFLIPGYVESGDYFWWGESHRLVRRAQVDKVTSDERTYRLTHPLERSLLADSIDACLRHSSSVAGRESFLASMRQAMAVPPCVTVEEEEDLPLTWAEIRKMQMSGWISFGAHTMHHPVLVCLADPAEVRREVSECRSVLEQQLGQRVRTFAYPIGRPEHIGDEALKVVQEAGYDWAVTTVYGFNTTPCNPYLLQRVPGDVSRHWLVMAAEISGIWHLCAPLWKAALGKGETA
jgi:peptidoglycan/xylan/chitin deacetylase (PgdA/CDA1 family)